MIHPDKATSTRSCSVINLKVHVANLKRERAAQARLISGLNCALKNHLDTLLGLDSTRIKEKSFAAR
jgi:hypothetical protein